MGSLVSTRKKVPSGSFRVFPRSLSLKGAYPRTNSEPPPPRDQTQITGFSVNSRRRLRFTALNAWPQLVSQFGMTYHSIPIDGNQVKADLRRFRKTLTVNLGVKSFLWILEFQRRGSPHFHLFLPVLPSPDLHARLASAWLSASGQSSDPECVAFHNHDKNFIKWDMGNGSYLCKYLEKEAQKIVPANYLNVGRFWGCSRGLIPMPIDVDFDSFTDAHEIVNESSGAISDPVILAARWLGKWYERQSLKKNRKHKRNFRVMAHKTGWTLSTGAAAFLQIEKYLYRQSELFKEIENDLIAKMAIRATRKAQRKSYFCEVAPFYPDEIAENLQRSQSFDEFSYQ